MTTTRPTRRALLATAAAALATAATLQGAPAHAKGAKLVAIGLGTAETTAAGATYSGEGSGSPLAGAFSGRMAASDGSLPALGECEPATATLRMSDGGRSYELASTGEVCALFLPLGVMQRFTGQFTVASTDVKKVARSTGVVDIRLMNSQSDVYATS